MWRRKYRCEGPCTAPRSFSPFQRVHGAPGSIYLNQLQQEGQIDLPFAQQRLCNDSLLTKNPYCIFKCFSGRSAHHGSHQYLLQMEKHLGFSYFLLDQFISILILLISSWFFATSHCGRWTSVWLTPHLRGRKSMDEEFLILESQEVVLHLMMFSKFSSKWTFFGLSNWKQKSAQGKWVNLLSLKKILLKDLCMEKTEVKNYMDLKNESCFKIKIKVALCSNTILQHLQTHLFTIFVGKDFCCRFQLWLINGKKSQDDLAGLCLIKSNKRSNKWANQEGTYVRAPCPGLWELGPCTLPNQTVSLRGICHELKDYLKRREPAALQFGCLKTSVTAGFPLVSKRVALPLVWAPDVPQPSAWQRPPQTALFLEVGLRLSKP